MWVIPLPCFTSYSLLLTWFISDRAVDQSKKQSKSKNNTGKYFSNFYSYIRIYSRFCVDTFLDNFWTWYIHNMHSKNTSQVTFCLLVCLRVSQMFNDKCHKYHKSFTVAIVGDHKLTSKCTWKTMYCFITLLKNTPTIYRTHRWPVLHTNLW